MRVKLSQESKLLRLSVIGALFFGVFGLSWGIYIQSGAIVFDGFYSFLGTFLSAFALVVNKHVESHESEKFQFGKYQLEPLFIIIRSLMMITFITYSVINSILVIVSGGIEIAAELALVYASISFIGCLFFWIYFGRSSKINSMILKTEILQWKIDSFLSAGVILTYLVYLLLENGRFAFFTVYIDPVLVIILSVIVVGTPIKMAKRNFKDLILYAPGDEVANAIKYEVNKIKIKEELLDSKTRIGRVGRIYYVEINYLVEDSWVREIKWKDAVAQRVEDVATSMNANIWLTVMFTAQKKWL